MSIFSTPRIAELDTGVPFTELRKRARILVIDDDANAFPTELLRKEGYNVQYWPRIENLRELESGEYDIIVLDIRGVADKAVSQTDGLGILEHLKRHNPAQIVIAYSGQKYDLSHEKFWKLADDCLGKPSSLVTCKEKIDQLLKTHFIPAHYWSVIEALLKTEGATPKQVRSFEKELVKSLKTKQPVSVSTVLPYVTLGHHALALVNSLVAVIWRLFLSAP